MEIFKYEVAFKEPTGVEDIIHHEYGVVAGDDYDTCVKNLVEYYGECLIYGITVEVLDEEDEGLNHGVCPSRCFPHK